MLLIETFMLEPAKLATNCVSASGNINLRRAAAVRGVAPCDIRPVLPGLQTCAADKGSIATVAHDVRTTVTGIQTAITLYTLVMASLMITGGKIGQTIGRKWTFAIGCIIYRSRSWSRPSHPASAC
jgi:hypothetical protein